MSKKLPHTLENVCLSTDEECQMYAVGSKAHTDLLDSRTLQVYKHWRSQKGGDDQPPNAVIPPHPDNCC